MISLTDSQVPNPQFVGAKAVSLCRMRSLGCRIPPGYIFETSYGESLITHAGLQKRIQWLEEQGPLLKEAYVLELGKGIAQQLRETSWPPAFARDLRECFEVLGRGNTPLICRSSCLLEDSQEKAYPGIFLSEAGLTSFEALQQSIMNCLCSLFQPKALRYWLRLQGLQPKFSMGLVIQQIVETTYAGVMFYWNPETILIEGLRGNGEFFMSGQARPVCYRKNTLGIWEMTGREEQAGDLLETERLDELARIGELAAQNWDSRVDIEFGFQGQSLSPYIFQCRPVTRELPGEGMSPPVNRPVTQSAWGITCAPGMTQGVAMDPALPGFIPDNSSKRVLLLESLTERNYDMIFDVAGIVTEQVGSQLNHLSIACRELGIPYVSGIEQARSRFHGRRVVVDGKRGMVSLRSDGFPVYEKRATVFSSESSSASISYLPFVKGRGGDIQEGVSPLFTGGVYLVIEALYHSNTENDLLEFMVRQLTETFGKKSGSGSLSLNLPRLSREEFSVLNQSVQGGGYSQESLERLFRKICEEGKRRVGLTLTLQEHPE
ncbi:MAG: PEP/pyruvate-binding domain-containing protein [Nitrospirales bacterium]